MWKRRRNRSREGRGLDEEKVKEWMRRRRRNR